MGNKGYSKDILIQGFARISGGLLSFVSLYLFTYLFNEEILGEYNLILTTINIITSVSTLWLSQSVLRYYNENKQIGSILLISVFCIIVSVLMYHLYMSVTDIDRNVWAYVYVVVLIIYNILDAIFRKSRRLIYYVSLELALSLGRLFPMFIIARITHDFNSIFFSQIITIGVFLCILIIQEHDVFTNTIYSIDKKELIKFLKYGMPLLGLSISNWFLTSSDRYIISYYGNDAQVGIYSTNYSLGNSIYMMLGLILVNAMHPIIINQWEIRPEKAVETVSNTTDYYFLFMSPLVFFGCLKSNNLLGMFNGDSYSIHSSIFIWTVLGIFLYGIGLLLHKYYECIQSTSSILIMNLIAATFNIILNFLLIPHYGFEVAAFTTFLSYLLYVLIVYFRTFRVFPVKIKWLNLIKIILCLILFALIDFMFFNNNSIVLFFVEGLLFIGYVIGFYHCFKLVNIKVLITHYSKRSL